MSHINQFKTLMHVVDKRLTGIERDEICANLEISQATYFRKLERLRDVPVASSIKPRKRGPKTGQKRLTEFQEKLIEETIHQEYLTKQKPRKSKLYLRLKEKFELTGSDVPSESTFGRRIKSITKFEKQKGRMYASERRSKHSPKTNHYTSSAPMALVQIDHTKLNAQIISQIDGEVFGRAIFTVITDIHTRIVLGYHIGLYGPDHESVARALAHACYDKTQYLIDLGLKGDWPSLGLPEVLHMDNAKEFKSKALIHGCGEYGIERQYRPVRTPHFGGHVESLIKTINDNLRNVPGATFGNISEKGDYPSEKLACFTLPMIEKHIANFVVNYYHKRPHSKLGISPMQKYQEAIDGGFIPRLPPKSKGKFVADFSESHMRSVRDLGVEFECKEYWDPYLASLYNQNISEVRILPIAETVKAINVLGPDGELHEVPAKDSSLPDVTRREWKRYRKIVLERNNANKMTNREVAEYIRQENKIEREAKRQSKRLRRANDSRLTRRVSRKTKVVLPSLRQNNDNVSFDPKAVFKTQTGGSNNA